jgi:hypothetical protein
VARLAVVFDFPVPPRNEWMAMIFPKSSFLYVSLWRLTGVRRASIAAQARRPGLTHVMNFPKS